MALSALHWKMLQPVFIPVGASPAPILDAVYTAGTSTTYANGAARVPGSGSAWTWSFDNTTLSSGGEKTACYATPPVNALNQQFIVAGTSATVGLNWKQMNGGGGADNRNGGYLFAGIAKNAGAYNTWNDATTPFTSGDFSGFGYIGQQLSANNYNLLLMWESEEAIALQIVRSGTTGEVSGCISGAFIDPLSTNANNAETDGRVYAISVTGINLVPTNWLGATAAGALLTNSTSANQQHFLSFTPGAGTLTNGVKFGQFTPFNTLVSRNGDIPSVPIQIVTSTTVFIGQLRQMSITRDAQSGVIWSVGGTTKGYIFASNAAGAADAVLLGV